MSELIWKLDQAIFQFINSTIANPAFDVFFTTITDFGIWKIPVFLAAVILLVVGTPKFRTYTVLSVLAVLLADMIGADLKVLFERPRPYLLLEDVRNPAERSFGSRSYSFPSNHAVNTFAVATVMAGYLWDRSRRWIPLLYILPTLIAISRVYVGVHFPSDVLMGAVLGSSVALGLLIFLRRSAAIKFEGEKLAGAEWYPAALFLLFIATLFRVSIAFQGEFSITPNELLLFAAAVEPDVYTVPSSINGAVVALLLKFGLLSEYSMRAVGITITGTAMIVIAALLRKRKSLTDFEIFWGALILNLFPLYQVDMIALTTIWQLALLALFAVAVDPFAKKFGGERISLLRSLWLIPACLLMSTPNIPEVFEEVLGNFERTWSGLGGLASRLSVSLSLVLALLFVSAPVFWRLRKRRSEVMVKDYYPWIIATICILIIGLLNIVSFFLVSLLTVLTCLYIHRSFAGGFPTRLSYGSFIEWSHHLVVLALMGYGFFAMHYSLVWEQQRKVLDDVIGLELDPIHDPWYGGFGWKELIAHHLAVAREHYPEQGVLLQTDELHLDWVLRFYRHEETEDGFLIQDGNDPATVLRLRYRDPRWSPHYYRIRREGVTYREFLTEPIDEVEP